MMNLHAITRGAINALHPDETVTLYRSEGFQNMRGEIKPEYAAGVTVKAQVQSLSDEKLFHAGNTGQNDISRTFYLFSETSSVIKPAGVIRPLARTGDMVKRADGTWWLVTTLKEDFSAAGWVNVGAALQINPPEGI